MTSRNSQLAVQGLRWVLGIVVLWQSYLLLHATIVDIRGVTSGRIGPHQWVRLVLASVEILAAVMFLAPVLNLAGSYLLLIVFAFAMLFHALQGQFDFGALPVYAMAVLVWMAHRRDAQAKVGYER
ncbi:MAG: DoxX family protein [Candidatus Acidiferrales bacterium]